MPYIPSLLKLDGIVYGKKKQILIYVLFTNNLHNVNHCDWNVTHDLDQSEL